MALDDLFLALQSRLDRLVRRLRLGGAPERRRRRLLIVQIDGLSRSILERGLAEGRMPFVRHLLARHGYRVQAMTAGLPTSTPAFQMAAMYGVRPDIPGFHYHDKRRRADVHFPRAGHAARVEAEHGRGRLGILRGGSVYGCVFTGGAENALFSFARLMHPSGPGVLRMLTGGLLVAWVALKGFVLTLVEVVRALPRFVADPAGARKRWEGLKLRVGVSVWVRQLFTLSVSRDLYEGLPAVYVNFLDYDVAAHSFSPDSRRALASLRAVDASIRQLWRVLRRVPEHRYDLYILSDHGQAACTAFQALTGGKRLERLLFDEFLDPAGADEPAPKPARPPRYAHGCLAYRIGETGLFRRAMRFVDRLPARGDEREAHERAGVRVVSAGPNAFVYVLDAAEPLPIEGIDKRFPGLAAAISRSRGVGFVLARSEQGPVCFWDGARYQLGEGEAGPFASHPDRDIVLRDVTALMAMPSAGDLVIYGTDAPGGHVSYIVEAGAHAGPSPDELRVFIMHPPGVTLPAPLSHPIELYDLFARYQRAG